MSSATLALETKTKAIITGATIVFFHTLFFFCRSKVSAWCNISGAKPGDVANRVTSCVHATITAFASLYELLHRNSLGEEAILGVGAGSSTGVAEAAIAFSAGYMIWDIWCMVRIDCQPLGPLIGHHVGSGACLLLTANVWPEAMWVTSLLLLTEFAVGFKDFVWALEFDQAVRPSPGLLRAARFALLFAWVIFRLIPFPVFFNALLVHGDALFATSPALYRLCWFMGVFLTIFNVGGLLQVALPGFPWSSTPPAHKAK